MLEWPLLLAPLLLLPVVLLLRFVGCGTILGASEDKPEGPPRYRDYLMGEANNATAVKHASVKPDKARLVAYWRLVDPEGASKAKDEKGAHEADYVTGTALQPQEPTTSSPGSEAAPGTFSMEPGLIVSEQPAPSCRFFKGAFVRVPFAKELYPQEFTLEAWVQPNWGQNVVNHQHTLFDAGGFYTRPFDSTAAYHGFSVYVDQKGNWQMRFRSSPTDVFTSGTRIAAHVRTHVAVSVRDVGGTKEVRLLLNGKVAATGSATSYSPALGADLFIGVANKASSPSDPAQPHQPILSLVQEVALHDRALSDEELENHFFINK